MPTLLLTRPLAQSQSFLAACESAAGRALPALLSPLSAVLATGVGLPASGVLVFTSGRAVEAVANGPQALAGRLAYCVGDRTATLAAAAGANCHSAEGNVEDLLDLLLRDRPGPLLHLRGQHSRGDLVPRLRAAGQAAEAIMVYRTEAMPPSAEALALLQGAAPVVAPVFSPRGAEALAALPCRAPLHVIAISAAAAKPFESRGGADIAARPDATAMQSLVLRRLGNLR